MLASDVANALRPSKVVVLDSVTPPGRKQGREGGFRFIHLPGCLRGARATALRSPRRRGTFYRTRRVSGALAGPLSLIRH